jgi:hypothetical protein
MRQGASKGPSRPAVLAWGLWALVPLSILVLVWLDQLLRRAGRPDLALLGSSDIPAFSARLRQQIDLDTLTAELLAVVDQTMQPTRASLWLAPGTRGREP